MFWRALSLRSKLLFLALAGLVAFAAFAFLQMGQGFQARQTVIKNDFRTRAALSSQNISSAFRERYKDVQAFALNSVLQSGQKDRISDYFNALISVYQIYDSIVFVDSEGKFVASNNKTFDGRVLDLKTMEGRSYSDAIWFAKSLKGEWSEDKSRGYTGAFVEDLQIDPVSSALHGTSVYGVSFSRSVVGPEGRVIGVVSARASLRFIENELRSLFELMQASNLRSTQVILLNKEGLVGAEASADLLGEKGTLKRNPERILRWNVATQQGQTSAQEAVAGRAGSLIEGDRIGRSERVWGFSPLKDFQFPEFLSWSVVVSAATEDVMSDLFSQRRIFYPLLLAFFLIFSLTGYGMARALTREYLEFSVKLKDETIRIAEVGDELVESCEKSSGRDVDQSALATQVLQQSISLSAQTGELSAAMADSVNALRSASAEIQSQKNASQRSLAELRQAAVKLQEMQRLMSIISEMKTRVSALNEIVFKVQLVGFNATIEANRAGQSGRGFAGVAQEIQLFSEQTEQLARELSEQLARIHLQSDEITSAVNMRVESAERIVSDSSRALTQTERSIPVVADALEESIRALRDQDEKFRTIAEFVDGLESVVRKSLSGNTDVVRRAQAIREQMYFLEDIVQEFGHSVKGLRVRSRLRKNSSNSVFGQSAAVSPERARADAVDRLAQKMRPRLVVKPEDHEPEVSDSFLSGENRRDAG